MPDKRVRPHEPSAAVRLSTRHVIRPDGIPLPPMPFSPAVSAGGWVFVSGQLPADYRAGLAADALTDPKLPFHENASRLQSLTLWKNVKTILESANTSLDQLVRTWQWHTYGEHDWSTGDCWVGVNTGQFQEVKRTFIPKERPASTSMGIRRLLVPGVLHAVDCLAVIPNSGVKKDVIVPTGVPQQLAGGALATRVDDWVFIMGEVPTDFKGDWGSAEHYGERSSLAPEARANPYFWYDSPIEKQTEYTLKKVQAIAEAAGTSMEHCVKADVYLGHPADFAGFEKVWRSWFPENPPARTIFFYQGLGVRGARVEIAPICLKPNASIKPERIETSDAPEPLTHEPQAIRAGDFLFLSGQMACDSRGLAPGIAPDSAFPFYGSPVKKQMRYILNNVAAICAAAGTSLENLLHLQACYTDFALFNDATEEWVAHFPKDPPAMQHIEVRAPLLVPGCDVILNLIAFAPAQR
jgi:enamine deaminase RidA (YjgF/YER057c/UK114 family)